MAAFLALVWPPRLISCRSAATRKRLPVQCPRSLRALCTPRPPPRTAAQKERAANSLLRFCRSRSASPKSQAPAWATRHRHTGRREISYGPICLSISHSPRWSPTPPSTSGGLRPVQRSLDIGKALSSRRSNQVRCRNSANAPWRVAAGLSGLITGQPRLRLTRRRRPSVPTRGIRAWRLGWVREWLLTRRPRQEPASRSVGSGAGRGPLVPGLVRSYVLAVPPQALPRLWVSPGNEGLVCGQH